MSTIQALCRANIGILQQKIALMDVLQSQFGVSEAKVLYQKVCPIVHASIGQHIRHSMDHLDIATNIAAASGGDDSLGDDATITTNEELHYDLRQRGGTDEHDIYEARKRIEQTMGKLNTIVLADNTNDSSSSQSSGKHRKCTGVNAYFMLSGDASQEFKLPTTIEREMGFVAHHAIHHMAMVKIITLTTLGIPPDLLPTNFGKAPSTIVFETHNNENPQSS